MAIDIWPYDQRQGGRVSNLEHEDLLSAFDDGILPGEASASMAVSLSGGNWQVAPGKILIAGHVVRISDTPEQGALPGPAGQPRVSWVCAFIDRSVTPWTRGVMLQQGSPGGGRPTLSKSRTGLYQVGLRTVTTATNGGQSLGGDERPFLERFGRRGPLTNPPFWKGLNQSQTNVSDDIWQSMGTVSGVYQVGGSFPSWNHSSVRVLPRDGFYTVRAQMLFQASSTTPQNLFIRIVKNPTGVSPPTGGTELVRGVLPNDQNRSLTVACGTTEWFDQGDRVHVQVNRTGGTAPERRTGRSSYFEIRWERGA